MHEITRPPRRAAPPLPSGELPIDAPPVIAPQAGGRWQQSLTVLPMLAGMIATAMMFGGREGSNPFTYVVGGVFGLSTLGMLMTSRSTNPRKVELMQARRGYLRYLAGVRRRVRAVEADQREALGYRNPEPDGLWAQVLSPRVWERRATDADFAVARIGLGAQSLATPLVAPVIDPAADLEPVTAGALHRFLDTHSVVVDLPVCLALRAFTQVVLVDTDGQAAAGMARALLAQLATFHAPQDLRVAAFVAPDRRRDWEWLKWLPHAQHPSLVDALGSRRLVSSDPAELDELLTDLVANRTHPQPTPRRGSDPVVPHIVVIVDAAGPSGLDAGVAASAAGVTAIEVGGVLPAMLDRTTLALSVGADGALSSATWDGVVEVGRADALSVVEAEALARRLAPLRLAGTTRVPATADRDLRDLPSWADLGSTAITQLWAARNDRDVLRIAIGTGTDGGAVELDLKEAAQGGMGPHGLVVGATGSGKSELLRTLVLGLAATHSSSVLNFVLVDFKGGATFASLDRLPHTSAVITNLADELALVDRMNDALTGELTRRQELLRGAGNLASVRDYERARVFGAALAPIPALVVVCDEFTELLTAKPELIDLFLHIGRVGRSLAIHLLLATQRLEEGRLRGLESHLSYRIALRTFSSGESRLVLGVSDAAELPASPGHGYLRVGTEELQRFKVAYVSGPYRTGQAAAATTLRQFTTHHVPATVTVSEGGGDGERSLIEVVVDRLSGHGTPAHQVWLPPLTASPALDELLGPVRVDAVRGLTTVDTSLHGRLRVPLALVDRPLEQRRDTAWFDLAGAAGHMAIIGNPQTGKSTAMRTLVTSLALTHTPGEVQVYCLDFGGGALGSLKALPHVGDVAGRLDTALVRRTVGEVSTLLADRERRFAAHGIDSMAAFRAQPLMSPVDRVEEGADTSPHDGFGDVFLIVDGWSTLRNEFDDLEPVLVDIATRGLSYGIHLGVTAARWSDLRAIRDLFGSRFELRLGDPVESAISRKAASNVAAHAPGRGLCAEGLQALTALPQCRHGSPADLVTAIAEGWTGSPAPAVRMLPALVAYSSMLAAGAPIGSGLAIPIGVAESNLRPVLLDLGSEGHLMAFGDNECGKSSVLRSIAESVTRRCTPEQARIIIVDFRRSLLGAVDSEHLIGYGSTLENTTSLIAAVCSYMDRRRPGPDVTPQQLRDRSWWTGPECFVLVDDYDLLTTAASNPLLPLLEYLPQARDVGLHLVLTRRAGGASRAMFEPILQRLRELGTPVLVMAGDRNEGVLAGTVRPGPLPPGRGWLVTRREGVRLVQLAYAGPPAPPATTGAS